MIPRFDDTPEPGRVYRRRPGVYALLPAGKHLLLTRQLTPEPDLQLPGGGIDPGEATIPALHREVMEETGWIIARPHRLGVFRRFAYMPEYDLWAEKICHVYCARPVRQVSDPSEDHHTALWMSFPDAAQLLGGAGDRFFVQRFMARR